MSGMYMFESSFCSNLVTNVTRQYGNSRVESITVFYALDNPSLGAIFDKLFNIVFAFAADQVN